MTSEQFGELAKLMPERYAPMLYVAVYWCTQVCVSAN